MDIKYPKIYFIGKLIIIWVGTKFISQKYLTRSIGILNECIILNI